MNRRVHVPPLAMPNTRTSLRKAVRKAADPRIGTRVASFRGNFDQLRRRIQRGISS